MTPASEPNQDAVIALTRWKLDDHGRVQWRWILSPWRSRKARWGLEVRRRPRRRHSQIRVHLGRHHLTLMAVARSAPLCEQQGGGA
jgi:hypothetical protein